MADLCLSCGEYVGQNAEDSPYCKCHRDELKELKEKAKSWDESTSLKSYEEFLIQKEIVERLKKRIKELDEYIQDQYDNHNNIAGIEEDQLEELQKILGGKDESN